MFIDMGTRPYRLKKRAQAQEETRSRIVTALMELHEELGPKNATISAIAERAGVQRLTVYRHFPDEAELLRACSTRWLALHPPPEKARWGELDGLGRCRAALLALYAYYRETERMWTALHRDQYEMPTLRARMDEFRAYLDEIRGDLSNALAPKREAQRALAATLGHVLQFSTWASLAGQGISDEQAVALALRWVNAARSMKR
jgi:AcrR family transcriptional regulator